MIDREAAERVADIMLAKTKDVLTLRYIASAYQTEQAIHNCSPWIARHHMELIDALHDQCTAIARLTGMEYADVEIAITGRSCAAMEELARRIGRDVLTRQGFVLPEQSEITEEERSSGTSV